MKDNIDFEKIYPTVSIYAEQAKECGTYGLYLAGCIMYGAALEAVLLGYLLSQLDEESMPSYKEVKRATLLDMIDGCLEAGIFSEKRQDVDSLPDSLIHNIRSVRNLIHPLSLGYKSKNIDKKTYLEIKATFEDVCGHLLYHI